MDQRRKRLRTLSLWQRAEGLTACRMVEGRKCLTFAVAFLHLATVPAGVFPDDLDPELRRIFVAAGAMYSSRYYRCKFGFHMGLPRLERLHRRIEFYDPADFRNKFRIEKRHARAVFECLGFTEDDIVCDNGAHCNSEEAFLIMMYRMASYQRLSDLEIHFGLDNSLLCRIFNATVEQVVTEKHHLLFDNIDYFVPRFGIYNSAIRSKILSQGFQLPGAAMDTALFTDGKSLRICRPGGHDINQARVYNGHHKVHCAQFQGTSAPDGMIVDLFGPIAGSRHDQHVNDMSTFNERLRLAQIDCRVQYKDYLDKGYVIKSHSHVAYRGNDLTQELLDSNMAMSSQRVGIEWAFGKISQNTAFVDQYKVHKVQLSQVAKFYWLAAILSNAHTCLYGSGASVYWNVQPPTLGSYFGVPEYDVVSI